MIGAALLAKNAVERDLQRRPWVKTTLAPGSGWSPATTSAPASRHLDKLGFNLVGYGCTTIAARPAHPRGVSAAVQQADLAVVSVLSGNRNFEAGSTPT
ncbi:MAG: aconitase family protein [Nocardioides sp.]